MIALAFTCGADSSLLALFGWALYAGAPGSEEIHKSMELRRLRRRLRECSCGTKDGDS